jgi:hypothetical protein
VDRELGAEPDVQLALRRTKDDRIQLRSARRVLFERITEFLDTAERMARLTSHSDD